MGRKKLNLCDYCFEWASAYRGSAPDVVRDAYPEMMRKVLKTFGLKRKAADEFIRTACNGYWLRLHRTQIEKEVGPEVYARVLIEDVQDCSERWSWDSVLKVQWLFRKLVWGCWRDEWMRDKLLVPDETDTIECVCKDAGCEGMRVTVHQMECPTCGRTYEHVNGDYSFCPHCGMKFGTKGE